MFTEAQRTTLRALVDRIVPADDFPSGWSAGVGDYLDRQFARDLHNQVERYQHGLAALDAEAQVSAGAAFAALDANAQDELLRRIEQGKVTATWLINPSTFFRDAVAHVMEGFYSDPANGGNRDAVSWRMVGFEVRE